MKDLLEALKEVEWADIEFDYRGDAQKHCPSCGAQHKNGYDTTCLVKNAIARAEAALVEPKPDADEAWKSAVIDQLVLAHILTAEHESDPLKAIQDLLAYHADAAVDPRVSGAAAGLVEQTKAEEREACAKEIQNLSFARYYDTSMARDKCAEHLLRRMK